MADNTVHQVEKEGIVIISDKYNDPIILKSVYYISGMKKNPFFVANLVNSRNYVLLSPNEIKFLHNIKKLNADVVYTGKRIKDLYIFLHIIVLPYVDDMIITGNNKIEILKFRDDRFLRLEMKVLGEFNIFLGLGGNEYKRRYIYLSNKLCKENY
ncbi:unnamed protein product [Musa acuminata subsp. burmannicoides]